jgi:hypothetical protein
MTPPAGFAAEVDQALQRRDRGYLKLLWLESEGVPWEAAGKELTRRALEQIPVTRGADEVVLFTGHRVDAPDRTAPRFPAECEAAASEAILTLLTREKRASAVIGVAGGANGGDILFLEACRKLEIPFQMLLALPEHQFIAASVAAPEGNWIARFESLARTSPPRVLAQSKALPEWLKAKPGYSFWERNNLWLIGSALALQPRRFVLAALWDGQAGDAGGGTQNMVQAAIAQGAEFIHLDTRELFGNNVTRSGAP